MRIKHRTQLRTKELRQLLEKLEEQPSLIHRVLRDSSSRKVSVERFILEDKSQLYFVDGELWLFTLQTQLIPGLPALIADNVQLPQVVVDMGAVPHIANGADVMAPGIVSVNNQLEVGNLSVVIDQKNRVPIAVGRMLLSPEGILASKKGRALETLHYVGDQVWKLAKELSEG
ncbi:MAG: PUA domain-containing protein [Promethearchaeota archaeon]